MTEQLPRYYNFDDLLPESPVDHSDVSHTDGTLTAEAIGYIALSRDLLARESLHPQISYNKAWSVIELGLAAPSYKTRQGFLSIAEERLAIVVDDPSTPDTLRMRALAAHTAIPSFRARAEQEPLTESLQHVMYHSLAKRISTETSRDIYHSSSHSSKWTAHGALCENLSYAVLLKSEDPALFPFPSAPREDQSDTTNQNHDLYIPFRDGKVPIQVKRKSGAFKYDGVIGINLLTHINQQLNSKISREESKRNIHWSGALSTMEPDVLVASYLDPTNPQCHPKNIWIANIVIEGLSKSIGDSVRKQMAKIIRSKGLGITGSGELI